MLQLLIWGISPVEYLHRYGKTPRNVQVPDGIETDDPVVLVDEGFWHLTQLTTGVGFSWSLLHQYIYEE
jgi:hypothetical protein